jgi:hypothetical protein
MGDLMPDIVQEARDHDWWWSDQNLAFRMIDEIERLRREISDLVVAASNDATAFRTEIERLHEAYEVEHQNCYNLSEKVIPNIKSGFKGIVYQLKVAAQSNDWDTFDDVVAGVLGYD